MPWLLCEHEGEDAVRLQADTLEGIEQQMLDLLAAGRLRRGSVWLFAWQPPPADDDAIAVVDSEHGGLIEP